VIINRDCATRHMEGKQGEEEKQENTTHAPSRK
jgi:hypothetical protein